MKVNYSMEKFKIRTGLFKHEYRYVIFKNVVNHGIASRKIYWGTYSECKDYLGKLREL